MLPNSLLPSVVPKPQFRAVISCGFGVDLYPLVEPSNDLSSDDDDQQAAGAAQQGSNDASHARGHGQTKALLPVAGKKMIDWVIERAEQAGVFDILVLTPASISKPLAHHLRLRRTASGSSSSTSSSSSTGGIAAKVELDEIPDDVAARGTVRVLAWAADKKLITTDFILLPCDLLLSPSSPSPSISLASLLDRHRTDDNLVTSLFSTRESGNVVDAKKDGPGEVLAVLSKEANDSARLLDLREMDEFDDDEVPLRTSLLNKYPCPTLTTSLLPTQLYIFSALLLPLLASASTSTSSSSVSLSTSPLVHLTKRLRQMETVQEFVGWVARQEWRHASRTTTTTTTSRGGSSGGREPSPSLSSVLTGRRRPDDEQGLAMGRSTTQRPVESFVRAKAGVDARGVGHGRSARGGADGVSSSEGGAGWRSEPPTGGTNTPALVSRTNSWRPDLASRSSLGEGGGGTGSGANGLGLGGGSRTGEFGGASAKGRAGKGGCKVVVWRKEDGFCARGNTVPGWVEINRAALKLLPPAPPPTSTPSGVFISPDSYLHSSAYPTLGEKVGIKRCIIGKGGSIGKGAKLTGCTIMDGVVIGE
ncbi:hypothetical protein JCM10212_001489, partial [Sporobolomyces blumeae]